jgi:short-subunit dehydrogenase
MKPADARVMLTGATGGIGRAVARALLQAGAAVLLVGRSPARLVTLSRELKADPSCAAAAAGRVDWFAADLGDPGSVAALHDAAQAWRVNVLVNNAGVASFGRLEALDPAHVAQVLDTNLLAPMRLTQALLPLLRQQPRAQVIQVGSALGRLGLPGFSVYSASKFGLRGFSEALRRELADTPVRVQYLGPRTTRTAFNDTAVQSYNRATGTASDEPERVARVLVEMLERETAERFIGMPEKLAVRINGLAPQLLDGAFAAHRRNLPAAPAAVPAAGAAPAEARQPSSLAHP